MERIDLSRREDKREIYFGKSSDMVNAMRNRRVESCGSSTQFWSLCSTLGSFYQNFFSENDSSEWISILSNLFFMDFFKELEVLSEKKKKKEGKAVYCPCIRLNTYSTTVFFATPLPSFSSSLFSFLCHFSKLFHINHRLWLQHTTRLCAFYIMLEQFPF